MTTSSTRRYLSVWLRRLATDRIARRSPASADTPLAVVATIDQALRITALNDAAARLRLRLGMALADARAMYPGLPVADADPAADARLLAALADWCDRYTPLIGLTPPDGLILDIAGCAHLFGGEAALGRDLSRRLAAQGFAVRVAIADTVGCAFATARHGGSLTVPQATLPPIGGEGRLPERSEGERGGGADLALNSHSTAPHPLPLPAVHYARGGRGTEAVVMVASGAARAALAPLPLMALRLAPDVVEALAQVGLKRVADVLDKPRAPLAARFGVMLLRRLDQALGHEDEAITPRLPVPEAIAERRFPDPIALEADVLGAIEHLARDLGRVLERRGEGARLIQLALFRADGKVHRLEIGTAAPLRDPARVRRLFEDRLATLGDACDPGFGYDMVRLSALVTERSDPPQASFAAPGGDRNDAELAHLIDRLGARFGLRRVTRLVPQDTHIPEFAVVAVPAHAPQLLASSHAHLRTAGRVGAEGARVGGSAFHNTAENCPPPPTPPHHSASPRGGRGVPALHFGSGFQDDGYRQDSLAPPRPLRLFARPEPVEVTALVPDGPPARFRWRQVTHEVACAEGPERIAMEWWRDAEGSPLTRDYFRIESRAGARVWLYREGLYGREIAQPRWFLHGLFA